MIHVRGALLWSAGDRDNGAVDAAERGGTATADDVDDPSMLTARILRGSYAGFGRRLSSAADSELGADRDNEHRSSASRPTDQQKRSKHLFLAFDEVARVKYLRRSRNGHLRQVLLPRHVGWNTCTHSLHCSRRNPIDRQLQ